MNFFFKKTLGRYYFVLRNFRSLKHLGKDVKILGNTVCIGHHLYIGDFVTLNEGVFLNAGGRLEIGNYCRISPFVQIHTKGLDITQHYKNRGHVAKPVRLEDGVWLCAGVIVTPGVTIGEGSVVAAGSVVTTDIPKFELWGGVPAKKIHSLEIVKQ